jgi:DNA-directed RNA polymerase II subunit RPB4
LPSLLTLAASLSLRRRDLEKFPIEPFELAQLGNLCPQDAQEAKALIPSLDQPGRELDREQLTQLLEQLNSFKQYS